MPKRGKTRKQKILADMRRKSGLLIEQTDSTTAKIESLKPKVTLSPVIENFEPYKKNVATLDYSYLRSDLLKTIFLTGFIAAAELIIRFTVRGI